MNKYIASHEAPPGALHPVLASPVLEMHESVRAGTEEATKLRGLEHPSYEERQRKLELLRLKT